MMETEPLKKNNSLRIDFQICALALAAGLITFLIYLPSLKNGFVNWDDPAYVIENWKIRSLDLPFLKWLPTAIVLYNWHPLTILSYAIDYSIWGLDPLGHHLTSLVFHFLNTCLVMILSTWLIRSRCDGGNPWWNQSLLAGFMTALLFGIHPLHVESVAWISERKDVLYALFYLLSMLAYLKFASGSGASRKFYYLSSLGFFALSLTSKAMAVTLPLVLLILDLYPLGRKGAWRSGTKGSLIIEKLPFFLLAIFASSITVWVQYSEGVVRTFEKIPFFTRLLVALHSYMLYIIKMIFPFNLAPFYPYPDAETLFSISYLCIILLQLAIIILCLLRLNKLKLFRAVYLFYFISLLPVIGLVQVGAQSSADRYIYLASLGPLILISLAFTQIVINLSNIKKATLIMSALFITAGLATLTIKQTAIWHDSVALWSHEITLYPESQSLAYLNRGLTYNNRGKIILAINDLEKAIIIDPKNAKAFNNLGISYIKSGNYEKSMQNFNMALLLDPNSAEAFYNRGTAYRKAGKYMEAIADLSMAIKIKEDPRYYNNRGNAYSRVGKKEEAIADYIKAILVDPEDPSPYYNLGIIYSRSGDAKKSTYYFQKAKFLSSRREKILF